eukprot:gene19971-1024_t
MNIRAPGLKWDSAKGETVWGSHEKKRVDSSQQLSKKTDS